MVRSFTGRKRFRLNYGKIKEVAQMPNLIALQKNSYEAFLQLGIDHKKRTNTGLLEVLNSVFPVKELAGKAQLEFFHYDFETPKFDEEECKTRGLTYSAPLKATFRLVVWENDEETGVRSIKDIKEQEVYICDIPLMTDKGTFIINGIERVVVSQMHRSPGVFFDHDKGKTHISGKILYAGRIVPYRGSWLDFEFDPKDQIYVRVDRKKKLPVTTLLMTLDSQHTVDAKKKAQKEGKEIAPSDNFSMSREEILKTFHNVIKYTKTKNDKWITAYNQNHWKGVKLEFDLIDAKDNSVVAATGTKITPRLAKKLESSGLKEIILTSDNLLNQYISSDYINEQTGEIYIEAGDLITQEVIDKLNELRVKSFEVLHIDHINVGSYLINTLQIDKNCNREEALMDLYRTLRPGEPPSVEGGEAILHSLFFDPERYDLSAVGRVKLNSKLNLDIPDTFRILCREDIIGMVKNLLELRDGKGEVDDIDNLANRRVRSVGELIENQFRVGLIRLERSVRERMVATEIDTAMPNDLVNAKPVAAAIREFFTTSQLSQFMDQTNPLSEITHKRRLSALGPGGLSRDRANFEVRDVHPTHYGRICPIETPEGQNIGLINSLATYARVNQYGFIESPYRKVANGTVTDEVVYLNALEESRHIIGQSSVLMDAKGNILEEFVTCRKAGEFGIFPKTSVDYVDVSPKQLVSVAASLIPFLENDDANRALMGSNMQRQAVPLLKAEAPLVGTGMEAVVAKDSGASLVAKRDGIVDQVDGKRIVIRSSEINKKNKSSVDIYSLSKFQRSNMSTCINQRPLVKKGDIIKKGDVIADGPATDLGELALGRNVLVGFLSWQGYNFEDSIVISERVVQDDVFTSIHIEEFEVMARDTKLGNEEITRDIPNAGDEALRNLDEAGIIYVGADVAAGDILVGKVTPKGEAASTPEEKLLRAIFGEKASDVKDSSLRVPPGVSGTVVEVRVFSRRGVERDERSVALERQEIERLAKDRDDERAILERSFYQNLKRLLENQKVTNSNKSVAKGTILNAEIIAGLNREDLKSIVVADDELQNNISDMRAEFENSCIRLQNVFENRIEKLRKGDELPPGVLKSVKVFIAVKRKLQPGDKMAGRHGNKGVVSKVVSIEDMPHLEDGTPLDIILNPLGLPSRMNVGQILETHLGAISAGMGKQINKMLEEYRANNAKEQDLRNTLKTFYTKPEDIKDIDSMQSSELIEMANNLKKGVPISTPVFDGVAQDKMNVLLDQIGLDSSGQVTVIDGRTGEPFDRKVTVGYIYILKLHHLVDDKIHARSIGPYSLVTQQPLGGKAQFGGQRFGEMEVWALEAYGAAYTLQEMLTIKSDDVVGRMKVYEAIVRGDENMEFGIPESFNVLVKELKSLGLNVSFEQFD